MRSTMKVAFALGLQALPFHAVQAQEILADTLSSFLEATGANRACILSKESSRATRNVLVWPQGERLLALVFRADLPLTVRAAAPCWSGNGACALVEGPLVGAPDLCETSGGLKATGVPTLWQREGQSALAPELETIATTMMPIAAAMVGDETWVALLSGHPVFMAEGERGARRVRIIGPNGAFTIARLRPTYDTLDLTALEAAMAALGTRALALVGPEGVLTTDGRVYLDGKCFSAASPAVVRGRLEVANAVFALEVPPDTAGEDAVYDDIVQGLLGGTPAYGAPVRFVPEQDALMLILIPERTDLCP